MIEYVFHSIENGNDYLISSGREEGGRVQCFATVCVKVAGKEITRRGFDFDWSNAIREAFCQALNEDIEITEDAPDSEEGAVNILVRIRDRESRGRSVCRKDKTKAFLLALIRAVNLSGVLD